jgi:hypothetical protein
MSPIMLGRGVLAANASNTSQCGSCLALTGNVLAALLRRLGLAVALHHDVVDVRLQRHADVLALLGLKLEDVQHARHAHLEEHGLQGQTRASGMSRW